MTFFMAKLRFLARFYVPRLIDGDFTKLVWQLCIANFMPKQPKHCKDMSHFLYGVLIVKCTDALLMLHKNCNITYQIAKALI